MTPADVAEALRQHGQRVTGSGPQWSSQCPAHDDRDPSLSVGTGRDGLPLLLCQAGCETEAVLETIGASMSDLMPEQPDRPRVVATYPYCDEAGTLLYEVRRLEPGHDGRGKTFRPYLPGATRSGLGQVRRVLYRLPEVLKASANGSTVYVVEGEKDVDRLVALGHVATCNLGGAGRGKWRPEYSRDLAGAHVVVIADRDSTGTAHARAVAASLTEHAASVRVVLPAVDREHADVSDHLAAGHTLGDLVPLVEEEAPEEEGEGEGEACSWAPVDLESILDGSYQPPEATVGARSDGVGLFYPGRLHAVVGESESGKTWFMLSACIGEMMAGQAVLYIDFEDDAGGVVGRLLTIGVPPQTIRDHFLYVRPEGPIGYSGGRHQLESLLSGRAPSLAVLDGITEGMVMHDLNPIDNGDVAKFGRLLPRWIANQGPAVVQLDHVTKSAEGRGRYALGGVHKLNGLNGAQYLLENRTAFGEGRTGRSTVLISKDRPGKLRKHARPTKGGLDWFADFVMESNPAGFNDTALFPPTAAPSAEEGPLRPTVLMGRVCDTLQANPAGLSGNAVETMTTGNRGQVRTALEVLVNEGYVALEKRGSAKVHRLIKPFPGDDS